MSDISEDLYFQLHRGKPYPPIDSRPQGAYGSLEEAFAGEHGITENGVTVFLNVLRELRTIPDKERLDVIALVVKCQVEGPLRKVAFSV